MMDGIFGQQTENAVIAYARANNLPDDGSAWPRMISMLLDKKEKKETNSCIQTLEKHSNIDSLYTIHYCAEHEKIGKVVNEMVGAASSAEERLTAWLSARGLWQNATEKMYEELLKDRSAKAADLDQIYDRLKGRVGKEIMNRVLELCIWTK